MKKMTYIVMALALVLGLAQCKKEQIPTNNPTRGISITLEVNGGDNGNSKVVVDPTGHTNPDYATVTFEEGDIIYVGNNGQYRGFLTYHESKFEGTISGTNFNDQDYLHFYFLGGVGFNPTIDEPNNTATVNIADQSSKYPVISYAHSTKKFNSDVHSYSAKLQNKVSIMKFNVITPSSAPICITGMNNMVTLNFDPTADNTDEGFSYSQTDGGLIKMPGKDAEGVTWAVVLPQAALEETGDAFSEDNVYFGTRPALSAIGSNQYLSSGVSMTVNTPAWDGDLSKLTEGVSERYATATDGMTISGTLAANVKVSIADGATVTLDGANINNGSKSGSVSCAGITCVGSATINLTGGSIINSSSAGYPGIQAGPSGNTLTIQGAGSLSAQGGSNAPGIGGGNDITCGNISLLGGQISACGGDNAPGLGCGENGSCGNIHISRDVEKINIIGGSGSSTSITSSSLTIDDVDDVSYLNTDSFVYHPVNLSTLTSNYIAKCGDVLRGTLTNNVTISIDDEVPATVILSGANINCKGIVCVSSDVKFFLFGTNSVIANSNPGIQAPASGTLTIDGSGSINVQSKAVGCAGIGGKINVNCGTINIKGGNITSCGGQYGAGIGSGQNASCGNIEIEGGAISATGGEGAAGIGSGSGINTVCGNIYLYGGIINACGGNGAAGIGSGSGGTCSSIEIEGGTITAEGGDGAVNIGAGEGGNCGTVTLHPINGLFSVSPTKQVRFSRGNLQSDGTFAVNQYDNDISNQLFKSDKWQSHSPSSDWYVLSPGEWDYLCHRSNKVGFATVNNTPGLIILPDDYSGSVIQPYDFNNTTYTTNPYEDNIYSGDTWVAMENDGVVFLPVNVTLDSGQYWSSSDCFQFGCEESGSSIGSGPWNTSISLNSNQRFACVRLVRTEQTD